MITVTAPAAKQIKKAAQDGNMEGMPLRLAAKKNPDGSIEYGMGFDDEHDDDMSFHCEGVEVIFAPQYGPLLSGAVLDFVELDSGEHHFVFLNPNDANYTPPREDGGSNGGCGCGSGGCGN